MTSISLSAIIQDLNALLDSFFVSGAASFLSYHRQDLEQLLAASRSLGMKTLYDLLQEIRSIGLKTGKPEPDRLTLPLAKLDAYLDIIHHHYQIETIKGNMETDCHSLP